MEIDPILSIPDHEFSRLKDNCDGMKYKRIMNIEQHMTHVDNIFNNPTQPA